MLRSINQASSPPPLANSMQMSCAEWDPGWPEASTPSCSQMRVAAPSFVRGKRLQRSSLLSRCSASSALFPNDTFPFLPQRTLRVPSGLKRFSGPTEARPAFVHVKHRRQEREERWRYGGGPRGGGRRSSRKDERERRERLRYEKDRGWGSVCELSLD